MRSAAATAAQRRGAVSDDLILLDLLAQRDDRLLVLAGPLVEPDELAQLVLVRVIDHDALAAYQIRRDDGHRQRQVGEGALARDGMRPSPQLGTR